MKKLIIAFFALGVLLPGITRAATTEEMYAQLASMQLQLESLLHQLGLSTPAVATAQTTPTSSLRLYFPNGYENLRQSDPYVISWANSPNLTKFSLALYKNGVFYRWINQSITTTAGSYTWIPSSTLPLSDVGIDIFQVEIRGYDSNGVYLVRDLSDAKFGINFARISSARNFLATTTYNPGAKGVKIGSYLITAPTPGNVNLQTVYLSLGKDGGNIQTLWLGMGGVTYGQPVVGVAAGGLYRFSKTVTLYPNVPKVLDVYADLKQTATPGVYKGLTAFNSCTAWESTTTRRCISTVGQDVTVAGVSSVLTLASSSVGNSVYSATQNLVAGQWNATISGQVASLRSLKLTVTGTANKADLRNVRLYVNGVQKGATLSQVAADGTALFDFSSSPVSLPLGMHNIQVYADVFAAPGTNFQFKIDPLSNLVAVGPSGQPVQLRGSGVGTQISVNLGTLTVALASDSPAGLLTRGNNVPLMKVVAYAAGEPIQVKWLNIGLNLGSAGGTLDDHLKNISLVDDLGNTVAPAIPSLATSKICTGATFSASLVSPVNCFGSATVPLNYTLPANTNRVWTLRADILPSASFSTIQAQLLASPGNLRGGVSGASSTSGQVTGSNLPLLSSQLVTTAQNSAIGTQVVAANQAGAKIGSYIFTTTVNDGVNLSSIQIRMSSSAAVFSNLRLMIGSIQFGVTQPILSPGATYNFSGNLNIPAGSSKVVEVYADVLSSISATLYPAVTSVSNCGGSGATTLTPTSGCMATGQSVQGAGQATLQVALDSGSPAVGQVVMGSDQNTLAVFRFTETTNLEDLKITQLNVFDAVSTTANVAQSFMNLALYQGTTYLGAAQSAQTSVTNKGYIHTFNLAQPIFVPRAGSVSITMKGDVASYSSSGATDNSVHVFKIATSTDSNNTAQNFLIALGKTSNSTSVINLSSPVANAQRVLRTKLYVTGTPIGTTSGRVKTVADDIGAINFTADAAGPLLLNTVRVTYSGSAPSATAFYNGSGVVLYDPETGTTYNRTGFSPTSILYNLNGYVLPAGTTKSLRVRLNSNLASGGGTTVNSQQGVSQSLSALINAGPDVTYTTAIFGGTPGVTLPTAGPGAPPIIINSVTYAQGT